MKTLLLYRHNEATHKAEKQKQKQIYPQSKKLTPRSTKEIDGR